jgi:acetyl-CoA acetyltransferase
MTTVMGVVDKATGQLTRRRSRRRDEGIRPDTTLEALAKIKPATRAASSRPATPASSPTAPPPAW